MRQVRLNIFETNSSSTHTLSIFTPDDYKEFKKGNSYILQNDVVVKKLYNKEAIIDYLIELKEKYPNEIWTKNYTEEYLTKLNPGEFIDFIYSINEFYNIHDFTDNDHLSWESIKFKTPGGEELIALCQFGYD